MSNQRTQNASLRQEMMLQINERLYIQGLISKTLYEQAKLRIVETVT